MHRLLFMLTCAGLAAAVLAAPVVNLLPDGGFELKTWQLSSWEICEHKAEFVAEAHSGGTAIMLTGIARGKDNKVSALAIPAPVKVQGDRDYLLALWVRSEADKPLASVSVLSYKEPFAPLQWKTPQTGYRTYNLPASKTWRLWTLKFHMPAESVEAIVMPRIAEIGSAWFDDVSLVPAGQASLQFSQRGIITRLPDTRRVQAKTECPPQTACKLEVHARATGERLVSVAAKPTVDLTPKLQEGDWLDATLLEPVSGGLLAHAELRVPPLVDFQLVCPRYRQSFYATSKRDRVEARLTVNATAEVAKKLAYTASLGAPTGKPVACAPEQTIRMALPAAGGTDLTLKVAVTGGPRPYSFSAPFKLVPPPPAGVHEFIVGDDNQLLMDGQPFLVRGFMGGDAKVYEPLAKAGYNCGYTFSGSAEGSLKYLDGLQTLGMYGCIGLPETFVNKGTTEGLREAVRQVKSHPALLGYYLVDEPTPNKPGQTPKDLQAYYDIIADEDPYHPVMTTFYEPEFADDFENCVDILMFDPYPVKTNQLPLTMVSQFILRARELTGDRKPVFLVPQAFGWEIIEGLQPPYPYTTPTPEEARCMSYLGLATGAQGLVYYCWHVYTKFDQKAKDEGKWPWVLGGYLPEKQPALWGALEKVGEDLKLLAPALGRPSSMWSQDGLYLREIPPVEGQMGYLIAVNPSDDNTVETTVKLQTRLPRLPELEEIDRSACCVKVAGNEATVVLAPRQVGIYKLPGQ